jgi:hypothetical protein
MAFWHRHKWKTVAIDTSHGCSKVDLMTQKASSEYMPHIIKFQHCACGERKIEADDADSLNREYAMKHHTNIALQRTLWEESGKITNYDDEKITWIDPTFAPLGGFEAYLKAMKADPELQQMLTDHTMVDDALGQFEVAVKLHMNNKAVTP